MLNILASLVFPMILKLQRLRKADSLLLSFAVVDHVSLAYIKLGRTDLQIRLSLVCFVIIPDLRTGLRIASLLLVLLIWIVESGYIL